MVERVITRDAHAKINTSLRVLGRRDDGYHDIESTILPVSLSDEVTVRADPELRLTIKGEFAEQTPLGDDNLVIRAARALAAYCGVEAGADIELTKRIPVAAGLGGGSADAAATLLSLNELWGCDVDGDALLGLGAELGSDVPALLRGGPVEVGGRGEIVEPAEGLVPSWWVLVPQPFEVSVADVYRWWDEDGGASDPAGVNDLEPVVARRHPEITSAKESLIAAGAEIAFLCGSGPTVAGRARDEAGARLIFEATPGSIPVSAPP